MCMQYSHMCFLIIVQHFTFHLQIAALTKTWAGKWEGYQNIIEVYAQCVMLYMFMCNYNDQCAQCVDMLVCTYM